MGEFTEIQKIYLSIWDERELMNHWGKRYVTCFETGKKLYRDKYRENWACYSHILPKERYSQYKEQSWNIKIVDPNSHFIYENFPEKAVNQYNERIKLLELHKKGEL